VEDLNTYLALHHATCDRTGARPHPRSYFEVIWRRFLPHRLARILFAQLDGEVIAARNFGVYKSGALTWTAAGHDDAGPLGANALLQWEAMRTFAEEGIAFSETGEGFPGTADAKLRGLSEFKQSFGGELLPFYRGRIDLRPRALRVLDALRH
jgi:lipid II:glycine glycyltransferase (peptidoglycan interpeptide bridge formation enzyme)